MIRAALALVLGLVAGSCGYSTGFTVPEGVETIGVEVFGNDSVQRDLELEMHAALVRTVTRLVHAPLVSPDKADLVLRGRIVEYRHRAGIRSSDNVLLETGVRIIVDAQLVRRFPQSIVALGAEPDRSGEPPSSADDRISMPATAPNERVLRPMRAVQEFGYRLSEPQGEALARERTLENLSDRIVLDLFGALAYEGVP